MIRSRFPLTVVLLALLLTAPAARGEDQDEPADIPFADAPVPGPIPARVVRIFDGDTVRVRAHIWLGQNIETNVRLAGIDTAEKHAHCDYERDMAARATAFVATVLTADGTIELSDIRYDKYGRRVVARIRTPSGQDLSQALLAAHLAHVYDGGHKQSWCGRDDSAAD